MKRAMFALVLAASLLGPGWVPAAEPLSVKPLAERKVAELPPGPLYWRIENFPDAAAARAVAGPWSLVAEADGRAWLFTLGPRDAATAGGTKIADVGPIPRFGATTYLLRINEARGAPGSTTAVHSHPGSEAFYVIRGEQSIRTSGDVLRVRAGEAEAGRGGDVPMQVSSSGEGELHALVMFVVDASRPFSSPATMR